jgi:hypothetical protein
MTFQELDLLKRCARQFRLYEKNHADKADRFDQSIYHAVYDKKDEVRKLRDEARMKSQVNKDFADEIEAMIVESGQ